MANPRLALLIGMGVLTCTLALGQQSSTSTGQQSSGSTGVPVSSDGTNGDISPLVSSSVLSSDNRPPSGAQPLGLGIPGRSELNIDLNASGAWQNNAPGIAPNSWSSIPSFGGSVRLSHGSTQSQTVLNYTGNLIYYSYLNPAWTTYQNFSFSQTFKVGRWTLTGVDAFNYSPDSPFGYYGYGTNPANALSTPSAVNPQYVPSQTILTPTTTSYFNSVLGQIEYGLSRRSSWTATGSYGILRFPDSGGLNATNQLVVSTGYNHALTSKDTVSLTYNYSDFRYVSTAASFTTQNVQLGYSRRVTGRLSFQISGGPEFTNAVAVGGARKQTQFSGNVNLLYSRGTTHLGLTYFEGTTGGSGVLTGARTDSVQLSVGHEFSKQWKVGSAIGYSRNTGFSSQPGLAQSRDFDTFFVTPSLSRALTRNLGTSVTYSYQRQLTQSNCAGLVCGTMSWNVLSVGLDYRFRPIRLE